MKKLIYIIVILIPIFACEDVINVEVPSDQPRLIVDGLIKVFNNETTTGVTIKTNLTSSFFEEVVPVSVTNVQLSNTIGTLQIDLTESNKGIYTANVATDLLKEADVILTIAYNNEIYEANAKFISAVPIDNLILGEGTLFGQDETEIIITYTDNPAIENYYLFDFDFNEYLVSEDTFYKGEQFEFSYFYDTELQPGQTLQISLLGVDDVFYNYMNQVIVQSGGNQGPFQTPAGTVRGNIVNTTNINQFALGFFAISETYTQTIIID